MATYADFSNTAKEKRYATIGDREFDVTRMPLSVILFINKRTNERKRDGLGVLYEDYFEALHMWLKSQDQDITAKWMNENLDGTQFQQIVFSLFVDMANVPLVKFQEKTPSLKPEMKSKKED